MKSYAMELLVHTEKLVGKSWKM